jgi:hypothetical protein
MEKRALAEDLLRAVALCESFRLNHHAPRRRRLRKLEVDDRLFLGNLDALDLFEFLDARLHLLGLGGLRAKAIDEGFKMLDLLALILVGGNELRASLFLLRKILRVIALINGEALVPYLHGAVDGDVEKVAIVRDENVAEGIALQIAFEPVARFEIEMVGGLVEEQKIRPREQQFGQRNSHLPAAAELIRQARPVLLHEAESGEHCPDLRVQRVAVEDVEPLLQHGIALGRCFVLGTGVIELSHLPCSAFDLALHRAQFVEDRQALFKDGAPGQLQPLLRQVADAHAAGLLHHAVVKAFETGEHLHQRGFSGAVGTDKRGFLVAADEPIGFEKENARTKPLAGILQREHVFLFSHRACGKLPIRTRFTDRSNSSQRRGGKLRILGGG